MREFVEELTREIARLECELELYADGSRCECCRKFFARSSLATGANDALFCQECEDEVESEVKERREHELNFLRSR